MAAKRLPNYWQRTHNGDNQIWELEPLEGGFFKLRNRATGKYLKAGKTFETGTYSLEKDQEWIMESNRLTNRENKIFLDFQKIVKSFENKFYLY